jgi:chromosome segregation ATPase
MLIIEMLVSVASGAMIIHGFLLWHDYFERRKLLNEIDLKIKSIENKIEDFEKEMSNHTKTIVDVKDRVASISSSMSMRK